MKTKYTGYILSIFTASILFPMVSFSEIKIGDTRDAVIAELGQPKSSMRSATTELMRYDRGKVELENEKVTLVEVMSEESFRVFRERAVEEALERQAAAEARRAFLIEEGTKVKERLVGDASFNRASFQRQADIWQRFKKKYPDVDVTVEFTRALLQWEVEMAQNRKHQAELDALTKKANDEKRRADQARLELARERDRLERERERDRRRTVYYPPHYYDGYYPAGLLAPTTYTSNKSKEKKSAPKPEQVTFQKPIEFGYKFP